MKLQTNEETDENQTQTDEINLTNKWTQHPPTDSKGFGSKRTLITSQLDPHDITGLIRLLLIGDKAEAEKSILSKYKITEDFNQLQEFLKKSTKVVEILLNEKEASSNKELKTHKKSQIQFAKGCVDIKTPDIIANHEAMQVTNCAFSLDNQQYFAVCFDYKDNSEFYNKSMIVVYNTDEPNVPYR